MVRMPLGVVVAMMMRVPVVMIVTVSRFAS
jgi:hypothetical protein